MTKLEKETIVDNIDGAIELIKVLAEDSKSKGRLIDSLVAGNISMLKQTQAFINSK